MVADIPRVTTLHRAPSIKIKTPSILSTPKPLPAPAEGTTVTAATPVLSRKPSIINVPKPATPADTPTSGSVPKRPRPEKDENGSPAPKRPKTETHRSTPKSATPDGVPRKRRMVTLRTSNPKRLALILGQSMSPPPPNRTALPSLPAYKESSPAGDSIVAKPIRKPLPSGGERKPLPGGLAAAMAPPSTPSLLKVNTKVSPAPPSRLPGGSASASTPTPTSARPKIKIKVKAASSGASQSPPPR